MRKPKAAETSPQPYFVFEQPLTEIPASQVPPPPAHEDDVAMVERLKAALPGLNDFSSRELLIAAGIPAHGITGWHVSRALDAIQVQQGERPLFQSYKPEGGSQWRYKRLPEMALCPGFEDGEPCQHMTRGGIRCSVHLAREEAELEFQRIAEEEEREMGTA